METTHTATPTQKEGFVAPGISNADAESPVKSHAWMLEHLLGKHAYAESLLAKRCAAGDSHYTDKQVRSAIKQAGISVPFFNQMAKIGKSAADPIHEAGLEWAQNFHVWYPEDRKPEWDVEDKAATVPLPLDQYVAALEHYVGAWTYTLHLVVTHCAEGLAQQVKKELKAELKHRGIGWSEYCRYAKVVLSDEQEDLGEGWAICNNGGRSPDNFVWSPGNPTIVEV